MFNMIFKTFRNNKSKLYSNMSDSQKLNLLLLEYEHRLKSSTKYRVATHYRTFSRVGT